MPNDRLVFPVPPPKSVHHELLMEISRCCSASKKERTTTVPWEVWDKIVLALLSARPEALEKDAARYRWLKANHLQTGPDSWIRTGDDLEEAIDAGMREAPLSPPLPSDAEKRNDDLNQLSGPGIRKT